MQEYTSRQQQIRRSAQQIYDVVSRFDNLTPALADRVEEWQADEDTCSFKAKGFTVKLRIAEKEAPKTIKIVGGDGMMTGSKIQGAIDQIAEALAKSFNAAPQV